VIGSWSPRNEIASLKSELESTRELLKNQPRQNRSISEVRSLLGIEHDGNLKAKETFVKSETTDQSEASVEAKAVAAENAADTGLDEEEQASRERSRQDLEAAIDQAVELWSIRVDVARSSFVSNVGINAQQAMLFDHAIDNMNIEIGRRIDRFARDVDGAEAVQMEAGVRMMNDITDSIVKAYDVIDETLPEGWRRDAGANFNLVDFVDPEVGRPLIWLDGQL